MWTLLNFIVGSKLGRIVAIVSVAGLILFTTIQYIQWQEREDVLREIQDQALENYRKTRERIDNAIEGAFDNADSALEWLRNRNSQ